MGEHDLPSGNDSIVDTRRHLDRPALGSGIGENRLITQAIAGHDRIVERNIRHLRENHDMLEMIHLAQQDPSRLGHSLDHQGGRHDGVAGDVIVQMFLGAGHVFHRDGPLAAFELFESINPNPTHGRFPLARSRSKICL